MTIAQFHRWKVNFHVVRSTGPKKRDAYYNMKDLRGILVINLQEMYFLKNLGTSVIQMIRKHTQQYYTPTDSTTLSGVKNVVKFQKQNDFQK